MTLSVAARDGQTIEAAKRHTPALHPNAPLARLGSTMLRTAILLACCVPILAGLAGCLSGAAFLGVAAPPALDSHVRYLSGLLLGIGIGFAWAGFDLARRAWVFDILAPVVILGGLSRLIGLVLAGTPPLPHLLALGMELGVAPALWLSVRRAVSVSR